VKAGLFRVPRVLGTMDDARRYAVGCLAGRQPTACVALIFGSSTFAQAPTPSNPKNPNDVIPEGSNLPPYGNPINIETAKKVAAAAIAESKQRNWNTMCIAIVDPHGELVYFERENNCQYASISIAQHKARTAARYRRPTLMFETSLGKGDNFKYLTTLDDVIASRGGNPLIADGKVIGAIGASGGTGSQDNVISQGSEPQHNDRLGN
jgi:glc operon protein GlcG